MLKLKAALLSTLLLLGGTILAQEDEIDAETHQKLTESSQNALKAFRDGRYQESIEAFNTFESLLPKSEQYAMTRAHAHYYLASAHSNLDQKKEALKHLEEAMKNGYTEFDRIRSDEDLNAIRKGEEFEKLIVKYEKIALEKLQKAFAGFKLEKKTLDGKKITLADQKGKVVLLNLWGTWCPPCRAEIPHFVDAVEKYGEKGFQIIGLTFERTPSLEQATSRTRDFAKQNKINYPLVVIDQDYLGTIPAFQGSFPTSYFFGRDGKIRKVKVGGIHMAELESLIKPLLAEKAPETKKKEGEKDEEKKEEKTTD